MKKLFIFIFFCISLFAEEKKITLQLSWLHQFQFAGFYVAKDKGFYSEKGIDVSFKELKEGINISKLVESRKVDFAIGRSSILIDKMKGTNIVALAAIYQSSPMMLLSLANRGIDDITDLKNKKIMINPDSSKSASILSMLRTNRIYKNEVNFVNHSYNIDDLILSNVDAISAYYSNEPILLEDRNIKYKIFHPKDFGFDFYNDILFTSSKLVEEEPKLVRDFLDASLKGWYYAFENIAEVSELIYKKYNTQNKSLLHLIKEGEILKKFAFDEENAIGCLDKDRLENIANIFKLDGIKSTSDNYLNEFIYEFNPHQEISFSYTSNDVKFLTIILILLLLITILIFLFFRKIYIDGKILNSVMNSTDDLIYYKDKNLRYIGCNSAFEKFVGKDKKDILGKRIDDVFDKKSSKFFSLIDKNVLKTKKAEIAREWVTSSCGKKIYLENRKRPFKYSLKDVGIVGICRDLTKIIELENEHLQQQKNLLLQSKIVAMGEMLSNIAHQWRQPLSVITTSVSGLKLSAELEEVVDIRKIDECSNEVIKQANYLSKTIEDFKSFYSSDESRIEEFDINNAFEKIKFLISESFNDSNINIIFKIISIKIIHNKMSFIQSILNIINNSKDAFIKNNIDLENRYLFITVKKSKKIIEIYIKDSAGGIDANIMDKIFEPYFTTKHKSQGTGIGLYMTHQMIKNHFNGNITVKNKEYTYENKKLKGACFIIRIPYD